MYGYFISCRPEEHNGRFVRIFGLNYLDGQYAEPMGTFCIVYGRRRVGKTRLLTHWLASRDAPNSAFIIQHSSFP